MKRLAVTILVITPLLSGCANQPTPAEVIKPVPYHVIKKKYHQGKRIGFNNYELGVTQEKITASNYVITVKLNKPNTLIRAKEVALYHGALLAKEYGARKFSIGNRSQAYWCPPNNNDNSAANFGGPAFQFHLEFIKLSKSKRLPFQVMYTNKTIKELASKVNSQPSEIAWNRFVQTKAKAKRCKNRNNYEYHN